jgi:hypothetical protein
VFRFSGYAARGMIHRNAMAVILAGLNFGANDKPKNRATKAECPGGMTAGAFEC